MLRFVLLSLAAISEASRYEDSLTDAKEPRAFLARTTGSHTEKNNRFGDYRTGASSKASVGVGASALPVAQVDVNSMVSCTDCEYLISSFSSTQSMCLTSAGSGLDRCSLYEDKLGFRIKSVKGPNNRIYFQVINSMDNICLQDMPAKINGQNMFTKTLSSSIPRLLRNFIPDGPEVQAIITALWRYKVLHGSLRRVYGPCVPSNLKNLYPNQLWQLEKVAYGTKQFLFRNLRTNRCLFLDPDHKLGLKAAFGVSDCTNPDATTGSEGLMQALQALVIQPRPPAVSLKQPDGSSRCMQVLGGRALMTECVPSTVSSKVIAPGGKHDGKALDFVPAGGCVEQPLLSASGVTETKTLCAETIQFYSPTAGKAGGDRYCLVVQRAVMKNEPLPVLSLTTEKCATGGSSLDPYATPLQRRGSFVQAEGARRQTWWVEKVSTAGQADKIVLRWRFWDGTTACLYHSGNGEVKLALCSTVGKSNQEGLDLNWALEPIHINDNLN